MNDRRFLMGAAATLALLAGRTASPCDTWVALPDVTASGHVIFAKNSDRPVFDCQPLLFYPRATWPDGTAGRRSS